MTSPGRHGALRRALPAALLLAAGGAAAQVVPIRWDAAGRFAPAPLAVAAGRFAEVCGPLPAGARVAWRFEASAPLDFNVHFHAGADVRYAAREEAVANAAGELHAEVAQDYCWTWSRAASPRATLTLRLERR